MSEPALRFEGITRRFGRKTAVDALDLEVERGKVLGLVGRNGSGKTTSLRLALGMRVSGRLFLGHLCVRSLSGGPGMEMYSGTMWSPAITPGRARSRTRVGC